MSNTSSKIFDHVADKSTKVEAKEWYGSDGESYARHTFEKDESDDTLVMWFTESWDKYGHAEFKACLFWHHPEYGRFTIYDNGLFDESEGFYSVSELMCDMAAAIAKEYDNGLNFWGKAEEAMSWLMGL